MIIPKVLQNEADIISRSPEVSEVYTASDMRDFLTLPAGIYRNDPNWVAPLRSEVRRQLDQTRNPFFHHAKAAFFLGRRRGEVVGRISAQVDLRYNEFHSTDGRPDSTGFWGFFECADDPDTARALFDAAAEWLAAQGGTTMVGPASFTLNDEAGLLVDGYHLPPMILMSYNPPYYEALADKAGLEPVQDLYAYRLDASAEAPADVAEFARSAEERFTFRTIDMSDFESELERFLKIYNEAWERNWGFVPLTDEEIRERATRLRPLIDPDLVIVAEENDATVAVALTLPDVNEVLIKAGGRLGPVSGARLLWRKRRRKWSVCRVVALGVGRDYRRTGVGAHLYIDTLEAAKRNGYRWGEMSWILESNDAMNRAISHMGGVRYKTYRMYQRKTDITA